jgi:chaperonin GroEL (HSP60 family)
MGLESSLKKDPNDIKNLTIAINAVGEFMKSNLGPNSSSKMFYNIDENTIKITKNGLVFIKELLDRTENAIVKRLLKMALGYIEKYGDGSKSLLILSSEMLKKANELIDDKVPRSIVLESLQIMQETIPKVLEKISIETCPTDDILKRILFPILNSYYDASIAELLSNITLQIYSEFKKRFDVSPSNGQQVTDLDFSRYFYNQELLDVEKYFQFVNVMGHRIEDTKILQGIVLDKSDEHIEGFPIDRLSNVRLLMTNEKLYVEERNSNSANNFDFRYEIDENGPFKDNIKAILRNNPYSLAFTNKSRQIVEILKENRINLLITEKGIDSDLQELLLTNNIYYIRRVKLEQMKILASFLNIQISTHIIGNDLSGCIGAIELVRFEKLGKDKLFILEKRDDISNGTTDLNSRNVNSRNVNSTCGSILVGGLSWDACEQTKLAIINSLKSLFIADKTHTFVYSNGLSEVKIYSEIKKKALAYPNTKQVCLEYLSSVFLENLRCLLRNQDIDPEIIIPELIESQKTSKELKGILLLRKGVGTNLDEFYLHPLSFKKMQFYLAIEFTKQVLRVDQIIPFQKMGGHSHHHHDEE